MQHHRFPDKDSSRIPPAIVERMFWKKQENQAKKEKGQDQMTLVSAFA